MLISHKGKTPEVHSSAYIAPTATICGDVSIGPSCRIMHGASIIAEGGKIMIGEHCIIFENAVVRSNDNHPATIGNFCLIGPNAHVVGCTIEDEVFVATGASIFHSAHVGKGSQIRINAVVKGKAFVIYWSQDKNNGQVRWGRIGNPV